MPFFGAYVCFANISALLAARNLDARIPNMSYPTLVPYLLPFTVSPFEAATAAVCTSGMLLFASAVNSGNNVDVEGKHPFLGFFLRFEKTRHTP